MKKIVLLAFAFALLSTAVVGRFTKPVEASGTISIKADGSIDPLDAPINTTDMVTYYFTGNINDSVVVERDNIVVDGAGYTVQGKGVHQSKGIYLEGRSCVTIRNMTIKAFYDGISIGYSSNSSISGNNITNNGHGISIDSSCNNTISKNNITANNYNGIWLHYSSNNSISGNNITANNYDGISIDSSSNNTISENNITANNWDGILLDSSSSNSIFGNNIANSGYGISLDYSSNYNSISGNNIANNTDGILLDSSSNNSISENNITANNWDGILLYYSSNYNSISKNNITANNYDGIRLDSSSSNSISGNYIANHEYGIYIYYSSKSVIYHNNFVDNAQQAYFYYSGDPYPNVWDDGYPSGGNYWSDYTGVDLNHDGIGETSQSIGANNEDNYPLMGVFSDFNATSEYHVQTVCNSSVSDFQFNGTAICFNVTGENGTTGFCRICIPTALMNETYKVFVNGTEVSYTLSSNITHSYLYFTYNHSEQEVLIIPEFPTWTLMLIILVALTVAVAIYKRRLLKTSIDRYSIDLHQPMLRRFCKLIGW